MTPTEKNMAILEKFDFEIPPVGVKFLVKQPEGLDRLEGSMALCEMLRYAQKGNAFFADVANHTCEAGQYVLGQAEISGPFVSGEFGAGLKIFESPRSANRLYLHIPKIGRGVADYVAFSPMNRPGFDPDLLILIAETHQTEIVLRAMSYRSGSIWVSKSSPAIGCAWLFSYPFLKGRLNYFMTGLGHGMKRRHLFPEGRQLISIPFDLIPSLLHTLREMPWVLPAYQPDGPAFVGQLLEELGILPKKHS